jgi:Protein of unknown function (DUF3631)
MATCPAHDDRTPSLSIDEGSDGRALLKCHAGCAVTDVIAALGMKAKDLFPATLHRHSNNGRTAPISTPASTFDWQECVAAFTGTHLEQLAAWRGYSREFCGWLKDSCLVGICKGAIAFPIHDQNGHVVAAHYRQQDGEWKRYPTGFKTRPIVISELLPGEPVYIFESQWDAFAFMDKSGEYNGIIITLGAENGKLVAGVIPAGATAYGWKQNDPAGDRWLKAVADSAGVTVKWAKTPEQFKDLNDWTRAGATAGDLLKTMGEAETVQEAAPVWSPEKLFNEIQAHITRYVVFSRPEDVDVVALWIMHTWVAHLFDFTPYIYLHSPVMRCGKTQVHRVVEPLVKNPLRTCNISEAALFREIADSHPTLLWDEIDSIFGNRRASELNENKRALLNAGYERGIQAIRMERSGGGFRKISYDPFCPKILAGIGRLPDTIVDRSIPILIHRRLKTQPCQKYRRQDRELAKPIRDALETWSADVELLKTLQASQPEMPDCLTDRQEDIWEPLLAIADSIGGYVPKLAREAARALCGNDDDEGLGYGAAQLAAIRKVVGEQGRITSADLIDGLWEADALPSRLMEDEKPNYKKIGHWLSKFIKSYGGKSARQLDFDGQNARGYEAAELKEVFDRYCPK